MKFHFIPGCACQPELISSAKRPAVKQGPDLYLEPNGYGDDLSSWHNLALCYELVPGGRQDPTGSASAQTGKLPRNLPEAF